MSLARNARYLSVAALASALAGGWADPAFAGAGPACEESSGLECGTGSETASIWSTAIGINAKALGTLDATAVGNGARANGSESTALGEDSDALGKQSTSLGEGSNALVDQATAVGSDA